MCNEQHAAGSLLELFIVSYFDSDSNDKRMVDSSV